MLLNLMVLYHIVGITLLPIKQEKHFAIALVIIIQLLKIFIILLFNTIVLF